MPDAIDANAALDFVLTLRRRWADTLYPELRREYDAATNRATAADVTAVAPLVHDLPTYPWFSFLERSSQKMLWRAVETAVAMSAPPNLDSIAPATLTLDASLELPSWYTDWDIHLQPGGVWSQDRAAAVYELGAKLVMLGDNDDYKIHNLFTQTAIPRLAYQRIVDLGCGFGKSTWPLKRAFPLAEVIGIDLAAPCLRLAAHHAGRQGLAIGFRQADASNTGLQPSSVDLVTSTMLVHEIPLDVLPAVFVEAARLLRPRGALRFLDFQLTGDAFRDLAMLEHGTRNNEPYMPPMLLADLTKMARDAGLINVRWTAFDERAHGRLDDLRWPRREEWHFPWAILEAEKPE
jgi:ubiquinone/menaquinone biosynthesis C-methylase UbiE